MTQNPLTVAERMTLLSYLAYAGCWSPSPARVEREVSKALETARGELGFSDVPWGPVAYRKRGIILTDSLMYLVREPSDGKELGMTLVIRGTNPGSVSSWIFQDLSVNGLVPWTRRSPSSPHRDAWISMAADTALEIHADLRWRGQTLLGWLLDGLRADKGKTLSLAVTGHSLGGLMAGVFALYLKEALEAEGLGSRVRFSIHALAGPTAGNGAFARALERSFPGSLTAYDNPLDIAPLTWVEANLDQRIPSLYLPSIRPNKLEAEAIAAFARGVQGLGYEKAGTVVEVPSAVVEVPFDDFLLEAVVQHVAAYSEAALHRTARDIPDTAAEIRRIVDKLLGVARFARFDKMRLAQLLHPFRPGALRQGLKRAAARIR